ncbi:MAG TPA: hypothetical protein VF747_04175 [Blastocatellia bacterium]|jgi:hypothetical protein
MSNRALAHKKHVAANGSATTGAPEHYRTYGEIENLVRAFESCRLPPSEWTHRAHLTVALWYLTHCSGREATARIRSGIKRYNAASGGQTTKDSGYHETITLFWICVLSKYLLLADAGCSFVELTNEVIARFGGGRLPFEHYSRDLLMSWRARTSWVEPDLKPL